MFIIYGNIDEITEWYNMRLELKMDEFSKFIHILGSYGKKIELWYANNIRFRNIFDGIRAIG